MFLLLSVVVVTLPMSYASAEVLLDDSVVLLVTCSYSRTLNWTTV